MAALSAFICGETSWGVEREGSEATSSKVKECSIPENFTAWKVLLCPMLSLSFLAVNIWLLNLFLSESRHLISFCEGLVLLIQFSVFWYSWAFELLCFSTSHLLGCCLQMPAQIFSCPLFLVYLICQFYRTFSFSPSAVQLIHSWWELQGNMYFKSQLRWKKLHKWIKWILRRYICTFHFIWTFAMKLKCLCYYGLLRISGEVWNIAQFPRGKTILTLHLRRIGYIAERISIQCGKWELPVIADHLSEVWVVFKEEQIFVSDRNYTHTQ